MQYLAAELDHFQELGKPVLIQESFYDDQSSYAQFMQSVSGMRIHPKTQAQWIRNICFANNISRGKICQGNDREQYNSFFQDA